MSNNLRQIAKDLRSFVKRCKDVHYSDSLLISFLITGLLTIAPKLHADVASEQQEITAQTYDAITDLRQSFMRARKENEKSLKGAQSELVQLLKQGDQVIKSPWASFQFGTGFTNNDWGTTYRGRGGKYLEYYRRDNDLTKYVFDKDKHLYGATNLNIPRNQEPNSLTINPANVHEPYKPYVPERLDNINVPKDPSFNPSIVSPNPINPNFVVNKETFVPTSVEMGRSGATHDIYRANNWINYNNNGINVTSNDDTSGATYENGSPNSTLHNTRWWWGAGTQTVSGDITGGTINMGTGYYGYYNTYYWGGYGYINYSDLKIGTGSYWGRDDTNGTYNFYGTSVPVDSSSRAEEYFIHKYMEEYNKNYTDAYNAIHNNGTISYHTPAIGPSYYSISGVTLTNSTVNLNTPMNYSISAHDSKVGIKDAALVSGVTFNITDTPDNHGYTGLAVTSGTTAKTAIGNTYNISPSTNKASVSGSNGILVTGGTLENKTDGLNANSRSTINVSGLNNDGVFVKGGTFKDYETQYNVSGNGREDTGNNGISATGGQTTLYADHFDISGTHNNGIASSVSGNANFVVKGATINVNDSSNNGIIVAGGGGISLNHDPYNPVASGGGVWRWNTINVNGHDNNGLYVAKGTSDIYATNIIVNGNANNTANNRGILVGSEYGEDASITIGASSINADNTNGSGSGIYLYAGDMTFNTPSNGQTVDIYGNGSDTLLVVDAAAGKKTAGAAGTPGTASNTVTFNNTSAYANIAGTRFNTTGGSNTGILIQGGHSVYTYDSDTEGSNTTITGIWDMNMTGGDNNVAIKNNAYARTLKIENNINPTSPAAATSVTSFNNAGHIQMSGINNIAFLNLGYVSNKGSSSLKLDDVALNGNKSSGAVFYTDKNKGQVDKSTVDTGVFYGTVKLQGAVGTNSTSAGSVGIYANTGQNAHYDGTVYGGLQNKAGTTPIPVDNAADLKVSELNFGLGKYADNSILVYASNGTGIEVGENNGTAYQSNKYIDPGTTTLTNVNGSKLPNNAITDGVTTDTQVLWGYIKKNGETSSNSIIGYATGDTSKVAHRYYNIGGVYGSHITFKKDINMVSKNGTALRTDDGAVIDAKAVRAGGYKSILAYANGIGSGNETPSTVNINGNIVAADYNTLGYYYDSTNTNNAYNNYGAVALDGGKVNISGTAVSTTPIEEESQGNGGSAIRETGTTQNNFSGLKFKDDESLIYGMAAYADGNGSEVTFNSKVSVIDGENGALYATNKGKINFQGDIINQNNLPETITTGGTSQQGVTGMTNASHTRMGKNNVTGSNDNDHRNTTPFYVYRNNGSDDASIIFNGDTNIDMYDGILLTGNTYDPNPSVLGAGNSINREWDYAKEAWKTSTDANEQSIYAHAKYKNTDKVKVKIMEGDVNIGLVNQYKDALKWSTNTIYNNDILTGIGTYAGGMTISTVNDLKAANISLINDKLDVDTDVNIEDVVNTRTSAGDEDGFNSLKMESTMVTVNAGKKIEGDAANRDLTDATGGTNYQVRNAGLSMANTLYRWDDVQSKDNPLWRKTKNTESGFINKGTVNITGGQKDNAVTALNVSYGTIQNEKEIKVDHGNGMVGTDNSILTVTKDGEITVSGIYTNPGNLTSNSTNSKNSTETTPSGANYGIVGISRYDKNHYDGSYNIDGQNVQTDAIAISSDGKIKVDGGESVDGAVTATGIFAKNVNANQGNVTINYADDQIKTAGIEVQANGSPSSSRGVGIALVNANPNGNGGIIKLKGFDGNLGSDSSNDNNIVTKENGIGVYAENAIVQLNSDKFTVTTKDDGVGLWVTDNSEVAKGANHTKTFQYNYFGKNDKNGFAMAFGGRNTGITHASNDLDIKFSNHADKGVTLAASKTGTGNGTYKGIAGILVNTNDGADTVTNRGNIEEDSSSETNVRAYGAVVNKGTFINYGKIKLNDSLKENANAITSEDIKKANVGIFANSTNGLQTTIENHGDITIGDSTHSNNIGSWAIYGYNVNTGAKEDGSKSKITVNRNNYGIYSGDGNVNIESTKLLVGNDTVLGHVQTVSGVSTAPGAYPINRQTAYASTTDLLSKLDKPRELDSAIGVYIDKGASNTYRKLKISADMDIDRFSYGIVMAEKNGGARTDVEIGSPTDAPTIVLASNKNTGGQVKSTAPSNPKVPEETKEQGNSVYYYSADTESRGKSYANVSMNGDYNTAYYTKGSMDNYGTIDLRSKYDVDNNNVARGYGNVGIFSANTSAPSTNYGTITTGMSDTVNMQYSAAMAAGRNHYKTDGNFDKTTEEGYIVNKGDIIVKEKEGIGMFATGAGSKAVNYGNIRLEGESAIGMYLDRGAIGENYGEIEGNAQSLKGVVAINGGYIKNYGHINVTGSGSYGIVTDGSRFIVDANGNPTEVLQSTDSRYTSTSAVTAGQTNGKGGTDLYGGTESSIEEGTSGNPKTTGVGTTITAPDIVPITKVSVDGIDTPIFNVESDAANPGDWAKTVTVSSSIQTGGTRIIDLSAKNEWGNPVWEHAYKDPLSEVTSIGMYVDTSGVRYTNPIDGIQNLPKLGKVDLYFGPEATLYTNSKAIRIGDKVDANGTVTKSNILKPFNDALSRLPGGAKVNVLSGSLTWQVLAKLDSNNQLSEIYMSKVPYHSFAYDNDKSLVNFTNNLDNIYEIAKQESAEKVIFNKLNSLGNGEGHILAQAFDQMRGHIYGGVQQRIKSTSDILTGEMNGLRSDRNVSKDSNKFKAFGQRNEFKTDTAGMPDWYSNAGGFA
ncbi:autotransporter-associated N-terminal domain-containing protein, partial [Leptotrichia wadei]|uniref:autotransporter-associated N-terminal domain-containing protein n=1 Tax=Leptotrichia wadei TaxID=157687 RepID=UPI00352DCD38